MALATLGGYPLPVDPDSVAWTFRMKTAEFDTLGGKVIQVYGTDLGDMSLAGSFGPGGWAARDTFTTRVNGWIQKDTVTHAPKPLDFVMPSKGWKFRVFVKAYTADGNQFQHAEADFNLRWGLVLFIVEDSTFKVVKGIKDLYITRLMAGIGWKQTDYNGPTSDDAIAAIDAKDAQYGGAAGYIRAGISGQIHINPGLR